MQDDQQYIDRILNSGSEQAVFQLVKRHESQVFNLCFRILRNREEAEEVAQDAFLKSFKELRKLEDRSKYIQWLMRIAYHKAIDQTRKKKHVMLGTGEGEAIKIEDDFFDTPLEHVEKMEMHELLEQLLERLPEIDNAIVSLYYLDGLSVKEVAEVTGISESNVKIRLMRSRAVLKKQMERSLKGEVKNLYRND